MSTNALSSKTGSVPAKQSGFSDMMKDLSIEGGGRRRSTVRGEEGVTAAAPNASDFESRLIEKSNEISAQDRKNLRSDTINYDAQRMIGHGSFGAVFLAKVVETNEIVAIKKVLQDYRFKNRELQIMKQLATQPHPYVVTLSHHFISKGSNNDMYLNLVLEYIPETLYSVAKHYNRAREPFPIYSIKLYMYQLARALGHIHGMGICHRDIKPQNLLVDPVRQVLKLCDFGSAKAFIRGEPNIAYICSRYYRAPELIFGSTEYSTAVDVWSHGCVLAECLLGSPLFPGASGVDQLVEIIKLLGSPSREELKSMNPNYQEFKFPQIRAHPWAEIFKPNTPADAVDLARVMLAYTPGRRCRAIEACSHAFFNDLRLPGAVLSDGSPLPAEMFIFTEEELTLSPEMGVALVPPHIVAARRAAAQTAAAASAAASASASSPAPLINRTESTPSPASAASSLGSNGLAPGTSPTRVAATALGGITEEPYQLSAPSGSGTGRNRLSINGSSSSSNSLSTAVNTTNPPAGTNTSATATSTSAV